MECEWYERGRRTLLRVLDTGEARCVSMMSISRAAGMFVCCFPVSEFLFCFHVTSRSLSSSLDQYQSLPLDPISVTARFAWCKGRFVRCLVMSSFFPLSSSIMQFRSLTHLGDCCFFVSFRLNNTAKARK